MSKAGSTPDARHRLQSALREFLEWSAAHPTAPPDELWNQYETRWHPALQTFAPEWIAARVQRAARAPLSRLFARLALTRCWFAPDPAREENAIEARLWELCALLDTPTFARQKMDEVGVYHLASQRLADLYRRAGRADADAVALFIEVTVCPQPFRFPRTGHGAQHDVHQLIHQGAHIQMDTPIAQEDVRARLGLCYRLKLREYSAAWIEPSIANAKARLATQTTPKDKRAQ